MSKKKILVVDDQANVRNILEFNLKRRGFEIISAQDGLGAIAQATNETPDLILLDIMMPGIDGFQVIEKLKQVEKTSSIPILIVSAKGTEEDILRALKLGAKDYIVKPFNLEQLIQKAFRLIEGASQQNGAGTVDEKPVKILLPLVSMIRFGKLWPLDEAEVERVIVRLAETGVKSILVDLTRTGPIETLAFGRLARTQQLVKKAGGVIRLITEAEAHRATLSESGFLKHFEIFANRDEALAEYDA
jgi:DNA-binding response OmpR family regulator